MGGGGESGPILLLQFGGVDERIPLPSVLYHVEEEKWTCKQFPNLILLGTFLFHSFFLLYTSNYEERKCNRQVICSGGGSLHIKGIWDQMITFIYELNIFFSLTIWGSKAN